MDNIPDKTKEAIELFWQQKQTEMGSLYQPEWSFMILIITTLSKNLYKIIVIF